MVMTQKSVMIECSIDYPKFARLTLSDIVEALIANDNELIVTGSAPATGIVLSTAIKSSNHIKDVKCYVPFGYSGKWQASTHNLAITTEFAGQGGYVFWEAGGNVKNDNVRENCSIKKGIQACNCLIGFAVSYDKRLAYVVRTAYGMGKTVYMSMDTNDTKKKSDSLPSLKGTTWVPCTNDLPDGATMAFWQLVAV